MVVQFTKLLYVVEPKCSGLLEAGNEAQWIEGYHESGYNLQQFIHEASFVGKNLGLVYQGAW